MAASSRADCSFQATGALPVTHDYKALGAEWAVTLATCHGEGAHIDVCAAYREPKKGFVLINFAALQGKKLSFPACWNGRMGGLAMTAGMGNWGH
jgi:hypothetical protein